MKTNIIQILSIAALAGLTITVPGGSAFADDTTVSIPSGTSVPGCEETDECYTPYQVRINPGDKVTWSNDDTAAHTVTSGTAPNSDGKFDSGLFAAGATFSHTFEDAGEYDYFCMVHPWMEGVVTVQKAEGTTSSDEKTETKSDNKSETKSDNKTIPQVIGGVGEDVVEGAEDVGETIAEGTEDVVEGAEDVGETIAEGTEDVVEGAEDIISDIGKEAEDLVDPITDDMIKMQSMTADGEVMVSVYSGEPTKDEKLSIVTEFLDSNDEPIQDIVYDIKAMQDGNRIFSEEAVQTDRYGQHTTAVLSTDNPVDIEIKLISVNGVDASLGPKGEMIIFHVVPEFGTIAMLILAVAIISIIAITAKTNRLAIMPKL